MEDAQSKIDQEITSLLSKVSQQVSELRTQRNELSPIGSLQFELLADVFWIIIRCDSTNLSSAPMAKITKLGTVCRKWHAVIQSNPRLWSQIDMSSDRHMHKMLEMSKCALLELRVDVHDSQVAKRARTALSSPTRNFTLVHLRCSANSLTQIFQDISPECLASLESLSLARAWGSQESIPFPQALRDSIPSRISSLRLNGFILAYNSPLLSAGTLLHLEVILPDNRNKPTTGIGSIDQLAGLLAMLPKLQHVTLKHAATLLPIQSTPYSLSPVSLPNLVSLTLHGSIRECSRLLSLLDIGMGLQLEIYTAFDVVQEIGILITAFTATCAYPCLHYMSLRIDSGVTIVGGGDLPNSPNFDLRLNATPNVPHAWMGISDKVIPMISPFLRGNMAELRVLNVIAVSSFLTTWQRWADTFGCATNLHSLIVERLLLDHVVLALRVQKSTQADITAVDKVTPHSAGRRSATGWGTTMGGEAAEIEVLPVEKESASVLWKSLKHITFDGMKFSIGTPLFSALKQRADAGCSIESICIQNCSINMDTVEELRCILKVDWDGLERGRGRGGSGTGVEDGFDEFNDGHY